MGVIDNNVILESAVAQAEGGNPEEAVSIINRLYLEMDDPSAMSQADNFAGMLCKGMGEFEKAEFHFLRSLKVDKRQPDALFNFGNLHFERGDFVSALECYWSALAINPNDMDCWHNIKYAVQVSKDPALTKTVLEGIQNLPVQEMTHEGYLAVTEILIDLGELDLAIKISNRALTIEPDDSDLLGLHGRALHQSGAYKDAEATLSKALNLAPDSRVIRSDLAASLVMQNKSKLAFEILEKLTSQYPDDSNIWNNLGIAQDQLGYQSKAIKSYQKAIELNPDKYQAYENLGKLHAFHGETEKAIRCFQKLAVINPRNRNSYKLRSHLIVSPIAQSSDAITNQRNRLKKGLIELAMEMPQWKCPFKNCGITPFFTAYQPESNKTLHSDIARLYRGSSPALSREPERNLARDFSHSRVPDNKIRIGFISAFFCQHTITKLNEGILAHLDRSRFEVFVFIAPTTKKDKKTRDVAALGDAFYELPSNQAEASEFVRNTRCDILHFTDIGMDPWTYFIAFYRMAPLQTTSWGHPDTTGIDTIDYFISSSSIEMEGAEENYSESLIQFRHPPTYFLSPEQASDTSGITMSDLTGVSGDVHYYSCPQSLFKIHPEFDRILEGIHQSDKQAHLAFIKGNSDNWENILKSRWESSSDIDLRRVHFVERMKKEEFQAFVTGSDVILDPIIFSGGVSTQEILSMGRPVVTMPGKMMRSRVSAGFLHGIGMDDLITDSPEDYVSKAVEIAGSKDLQNSLEKQILSNKFLIFENFKVVKEYEQFFSSAIAAEYDGQAKLA